MHVSIEIPVFKGRFLRPCIESVLAQTSPHWTLSLVWDGGDEQSREILRRLQSEGDPRVRAHFTENQGIAGARRFLTGHSEGEYILPLDDDDILPARAIERFLQVAAERPWASLIRARRIFIDEEGAPVEQEPWFPFGPRHYDRGMVTDVFNQAQPYLIRRSAYDRTRGWTGFADLMGAGEDCDIFLQLEEIAHFELIDEVLYHYRLHGDRASHVLTSAAAFEMWRRLCDAAITRMGLPLRRISAAPPFVYEALARPPASLDDVDFVVRYDVAAASLRKCGVAEDAIHTSPIEAPETWRMAGFRSTRRPLVCFLEDHVQSRDALQTLVESLGNADLVTMECGSRAAALHILVRREVIAATGGFDDRAVPASLQVIDFCIQARRRGFSCMEEGNPLPADVRALRSKWRSYPELLETYDNKLAGDGARRNRSAI